MKSSLIRDKITNLYQELWNLYGPQGWWPIFFSETQPGYHPNIYDIPNSLNGKFEVCIGAILTQNTRWSYVEKALSNLSRVKCFSPERISHTPEKILNNLICSTGFFRQKTKKLKIFSEWWISTMKSLNTIPKREELLTLWGIGMETADSILCYAYHQPIFVVDTYTQRLFKEKGIISVNQNSYTEIQKIGTLLGNIQSKAQTSLYQEFHALIVHHSKTIARHPKETPQTPE